MADSEYVLIRTFSFGAMRSPRINDSRVFLGKGTGLGSPVRDADFAVL
jgi:hypothetical protein